MKLKVQEIKKKWNHIYQIRFQFKSETMKSHLSNVVTIKINKINEMAPIGFIFYFLFFYKKRRVILAWNWGIASVLVG